MNCPGKEGTKVNKQHLEAGNTADLIGVLSAISIVSKRLAGKLILLESENHAKTRRDADPCSTCASHYDAGKIGHRTYY